MSSELNIIAQLIINIGRQKNLVIPTKGTTSEKLILSERIQEHNILHLDESGIDDLVSKIIENNRYQTFANPADVLSTVYSWPDQQIDNLKLNISDFVFAIFDTNIEQSASEPLNAIRAIFKQNQNPIFIGSLSTLNELAKITEILSIENDFIFSEREINATSILDELRAIKMEKVTFKGTIEEIQMLTKIANVLHPESVEL